MSIINNSEEPDVAIHDPEELRSRSRSPLFFAVAVLAALALTSALLGGYFYLRSRHAAQTLASEQQQQKSAVPAKPVIQPEVKIFEDEAMIKGAQVTVGGTVQNISNAQLTDVSLELELTRRADGKTESRTIALTPKDLASGEQGSYALTVLSRDFRRARIVRVKSGARANDIAFATAPGNQRPAGPPQQTNKTIIVNRPAQRDANGGFINTPDNPTTIR
ncbi:MAG TPA: hypothetical protein VGC66_09150 [Pyrinomonadaceae bacterium]|jgi:hypothetical protein